MKNEARFRSFEGKGWIRKDPYNPPPYQSYVGNFQTGRNNGQIPRSDFINKNTWAKITEHSESRAEVNPTNPSVTVSIILKKLRIFYVEMPTG